MSVRALTFKKHQLFCYQWAYYAHSIPHAHNQCLLYFFLDKHLFTGMYSITWHAYSIIRTQITCFCNLQFMWIWHSAVRWQKWRVLLGHGSASSVLRCSYTGCYAGFCILLSDSCQHGLQYRVQHLQSCVFFCTHAPLSHGWLKSAFESAF